MDGYSSGNTLYHFYQSLFDWSLELTLITPEQQQKGWPKYCQLEPNVLAVEASGIESAMALINRLNIMVHLNIIHKIYLC